MRTIEIKTREGPETYFYYSKAEADEEGIRYLGDWRDASVGGQRVLTDDGMVVPVLKVGPLSNNAHNSVFVRIPTGTFNSSTVAPMTSEKRENRFSFNGQHQHKSKVQITNKIRLFVTMLGSGIDPDAAHVRLWPGISAPSNRRKHLKRLMRDEGVMTLVRQQLKDALDEAGLNEQFVTARLKGLIDNAEAKPGTVLQALDRVIGLIQEARDSEEEGGFVPASMEIEETEVKTIEEGDMPKRVITSQTISSKRLIGEDLAGVGESGDPNLKVDEGLLEDQIDLDE